MPGEESWPTDAPDEIKYSNPAHNNFGNTMTTKEIKAKIKSGAELDDDEEAFAEEHELWK